MTLPPHIVEPERLASLYRNHPGAIVEYCEIADYSPQLQEAEMHPVQAAIQSRREEYSTGRWLAHRALARLGYKVTSIPSGENRQPLWPARVVGSIGHNSRYAVVVVASGETYRGIGIDIEQKYRVQPTLVRKLLSANEQQRFRHMDPTLIFSAKEAIFKLLYPLVGKYIDFLDVELELDTVHNTFRAYPVSRGGDTALLHGATGTFIDYNGSWVTCVSQDS